MKSVQSCLNENVNVRAKELNIPKRRSIIQVLNYTHYQKQTNIIKECHEKEAPHKWWPKPTRKKQSSENEGPERQCFRILDTPAKNEIHLQPRNVLWMGDKGQLCEG